MHFPYLNNHIHTIFSHIPWGHWIIMGLLSMTLMLFLLLRKKCSVYGAFALGISVFVGMFFLDTAVVIRYCGFLQHGHGIDLRVRFASLFQEGAHGRAEVFSNVVVFIPFGFFLGEWLASLNRTGAWRRVGLVTVAAFGLSLCVECLQLVLHVGFFELTDLVLNTLGGFVGALISVGLRKIVGGRRHGFNP